MIDRVWRAFATGLALAIFGLGAVAMTFFIFPVAALFSTSRARRKDRTRYLIYRAFGGFVRLLQLLCVCRVQFDNRIKLAESRGCLIVANHPSLLDVVLLMSVNPRIQCIVKHQLSRNIFLRGVVKWADFLRNDLDSDELLDRCAEAIEEGSNLLIFPEGTRTVPGHPISLQRGFANIAIFTQARMQIVVIDCDQPFLCKGYPWYRSAIKRVRFKVSVSECWEVSDYPDSPHRPLIARRLLTELQALFRERLADEESGLPNKSVRFRDTQARSKFT